jgi:hypothetical protein
MKKIVWAFLFSMAVLTVSYAGFWLYPSASSYSGHLRTSGSGYLVVYAAEEYVSEEPPATLYTQMELGIVDVLDYGVESPTWVHVAVNREKEPFPLQKNMPVFSFKDKLYQVIPLCVTPGLPERSVMDQIQLLIIACLVVGWVLAFILLVRGNSVK